MTTTISHACHCIYGFQTPLTTVTSLWFCAWQEPVGSKNWNEKPGISKTTESPWSKKFRKQVSWDASHSNCSTHQSTNVLPKFLRRTTRKRRMLFIKYRMATNDKNISVEQNNWCSLSPFRKLEDLQKTTFRWFLSRLTYKADLALEMSMEILWPVWAWHNKYSIMELYQTLQIVKLYWA